MAACTPLQRQPPVTRPAPAPGRPEPVAPPSAPASPYGRQDDGGFPRTAEAVSGPAVVALLEQARGALAEGHAEQAVAALETALEIEPRNPFVWQQLAGTHLAQHLPDQAENKARRSNSFARGNPWIQADNWGLIAAAREARGDAAGARQAREKQAELEASLGE